MSTPTDFEARLSADLTHRAALIQPPADGRARIEGRVRRRARRRTQARVVVSILVVMVLAASALVLYRSGDDGSKVVSVPGQPVPPMPQLGLAPADGQFTIGSLRPGIEVSVWLYPNQDPAGVWGGGPQLVVWWSDQKLEDLEAARVPAGVPVNRVTVNGQPAFGYDGGTADYSSGVYWKPDPAHVAYLPLPDRSAFTGDAAVHFTVDLADRLTPVSDEAWLARLNSTQTFTTDTGDRPGDGPGPHLGRPGGTTLTSVFPHRWTMAAIEEEGFPAGTFSLRTDLLNLSLEPMTPDQGTDPVDVRGTTGYLLPSGLAQEPTLGWVEGGVSFRLTFRSPAGKDDAVRVANQLRTLSDVEWQALLLPTRVPLDLVPPAGPENIALSCFPTRLGCPFWSPSPADHAGTTSTLPPPPEQPGVDLTPVTPPSN